MRIYELTNHEASLLISISEGFCPELDDIDAAESLADAGLITLGFDERGSVGYSEPTETTDDGDLVAAAISEYESWRGSGICVFLP